MENIPEGLLETLDQVSEMKSHIVITVDSRRAFESSFGELVEALVARLPLIALAPPGGVYEK